MRGRYFRVPQATGLGELPSTPLKENGTLDLASPYGVPPVGNASAPQLQGGMRLLSENQSVWQFITFVARPGAVMLQSQTYRKFFLIQNKGSAGTIFVGFGYPPNQGNGLVLPPGVGYEPYTYPINEIYVASDGPDIDGLMIFGV